MEELADRISGGDYTVFVISVNSSRKYEMYHNSVQNLLQECPNLNIICISEGDTIEKCPLDYPCNRLHFINHSDNVSKSEIALCLSSATLIFLVNMSLFLDTTGNLSANSIAILSSISRSDVSSFCLHPFENIRGLEQSDVIEGEETNSALNKLRLILQDVLVTHLVRIIDTAWLCWKVATNSWID